ncbi:hypothetical protein O3S74_016195, partial [Alcaligenes nematophilus]|uniref:hypothetical protein n=1 Tax=Alcaligenes nematophilus TaxID=2994643 RepID=UPI0028DA0B7B
RKSAQRWLGHNKQLSEAARAMGTSPDIPTTKPERSPPHFRAPQKKALKRRHKKAALEGGFPIKSGAYSCRSCLPGKSLGQRMGLGCGSGLDT